MRNTRTPTRCRKKFLPEEDHRLRELVQKYGTNAWESVASEMPDRNVRQCRERWKHYLSSEQMNTPWTPEEDRILFEKIQELGPKWTKLTQYFNGRTDIQIKTRWMKKFAPFSNLHMRNRPQFSHILPANPTVSFAPPPQQAEETPVVIQPIPKVATPEHEDDLFETWSFGRRDFSFGSQSCLDCIPWDALSHFP